MTFGAPVFLFFLAGLPIFLLLFIANERKRKTLIGKIIAARLIPNLAGNTSSTKRWLRVLLFLAGIAGVIISFAQPRYGFIWEETKRKGHDVIIAIDTSKSMLSTDIAPDRLTRAKFAAQDLVNALPGDRVGLVAFAGSAFLQAPLTVDYSAVLSSINELDTRIIPRGGTDIASAIKLAGDAFGKGESDNRCMVLFTDGEDLDPDTIEAAKQASPNFKIFTVGIGSKEGSLIPVPEESGGTSFAKDPEGQIVKSHLDEERLRQIADLTGGFYVQLGADPGAIKRIINEGLGSVKEREIDSKQARKPIERYQWPLAAGLLLLFFSFLINERNRSTRTANVSALRALVLLAVMIPSVGFSKTDGLESYNQGKFDEAFSVFKQQLEKKPSSPELNFNLGTAAYKVKDYSKALDAFSKALLTRNPELKTKAEYNFGNTLFQQAGVKEEIPEKIATLKNAIQHYDSALQNNPKHEEAKENKEAAQRWIQALEKQQKEQEQQKNQQKQDQDQKKDDKKNKDDKNDQQKSQDQKDQKQGQQDQKQDQKDQKKDGQSQQDQKKDEQQQSEEKKQDSKDQQGKGQQGQKDQKDQKDQQSNASNSNQQQQKQQPGASPTPQPQPQPTPSGEKPSGEIKAQPSGKNDKNENQNAQPVQVAPSDKPGQMSEQQAEALLQALSNDEAHVILNEQKPAAPVLKDW